MNHRSRARRSLAEKPFDEGEAQHEKDHEFSVFAHHLRPLRVAEGQGDQALARMRPVPRDHRHWKFTVK